jgi:thiamine-phosphate pyrophosphorylase
MTVAPRLVVVTDTEREGAHAWLERLEPWLASAAPGGVMVQLRDRQLEARERLAFGLRLRELTRRHAQHLAVNDRLDLALLVEADAVHLPEAGVRAGVARRFLEQYRSPWFVSVACHDPAALPEPEADALLLSPISAPRKGRPALGTAGIEHAARARAGSAGARRHRIYGLGGVGADQAASLLEAGADGVAVIGAVFDARGPEGLLRALGILR